MKRVLVLAALLVLVACTPPGRPRWDAWVKANVIHVDFALPLDPRNPIAWYDVGTRTVYVDTTALAREVEVGGGDPRIGPALRDHEDGHAFDFLEVGVFFKTDPAIIGIERFAQCVQKVVNAGFTYAPVLGDPNLYWSCPEPYFGQVLSLMVSKGVF